MSDSQISLPPPPTPTDSSRARILAAATGTQDVIRLAETADPGLAAFLSGKSLAGSTTIWFNVLVPVLGLIAAKFKIGLDDQTIAALAVLLLSAGNAVLRVTRPNAPITGVLTAAPIPADAVAKAAP